MPTSAHAAVYSATRHYLRAIEAAGTDEAKAVMAKMREMPINDFFAKNGKLHATEQIPPAGDILTGGSHSLTGRFDRQRSTFRGAWSVRLNYQFADGTTDQCQSGKVKLIATL